MIAVTFLAMVFGLAVGHLLVFHLYLIRRRLSTYDYILEARAKDKAKERALEKSAEADATAAPKAGSKARSASVNGPVSNGRRRKRH